jgi:hypothetical protein
LTPSNNSPICTTSAPPSFNAPSRPQILCLPRSYSGSPTADSGLLGTPPGMRRAWTSSAGRCAHRTRTASWAMGALHVALTGDRSALVWLRTGRCRCYLMVADGPLSFLSSSPPLWLDFGFLPFLRRQGCLLWASSLDGRVIGRVRVERGHAHLPSEYKLMRVQSS